MKSAIVLGVIGVGALLAVLGFAWPSLFPGTTTWTPEKAEQWAEVKDRLHNLSFAVHSEAPPRRHGSREELQAEYQKVKAVATKLQAELDYAMDQPGKTGATLKWTGVAVLAAGIAGHFALQKSAG